MRAWLIRCHPSKVRHVCIGKNRMDVSGLLLIYRVSNEPEKQRGFGFSFTFILANKVFMVLLLFLINQTLQNTTSPWLIVLTESARKAVKEIRG